MLHKINTNRKGGDWSKADDLISGTIIISRQHSEELSIAHNQTSHEHEVSLFPVEGLLEFQNKIITVWENALREQRLASDAVLSIFPDASDVYFKHGSEWHQSSERSAVDDF